MQAGCHLDYCDLRTWADDPVMMCLDSWHMEACLYTLQRKSENTVSVFFQALNLWFVTQQLLMNMLKFNDLQGVGILSHSDLNK